MEDIGAKVGQALTKTIFIRSGGPKGWGIHGKPPRPNAAHWGHQPAATVAQPSSGAGSGGVSPPVPPPSGTLDEPTGGTPAIRFMESHRDVRTNHELPEGLIESLETALAEAEIWLAKNQPAEFREVLLALFFRMHTFRRTAELYDERFVTIIENEPAVKVRLFCLDPSQLLRQALARGRAAIYFSATLTPMDYYRVLLGGAPDDPVLQLSSPFPPENLGVLVQDRIPTHFKGRAESLGDVVAAISA